MGKAIRSLHFALISIFLMACDGAWNRGNEPGLRADLKDLLARAEIAAPDLNCRMIGTTRDAIVSVNLSKEQVAALVKAIGLAEYKNPLGDARRFPLELSDAARECPLAAAWEKDKGISMLAVMGRPASLRLTSGRNFEYLFFFYREEGGEVCIFVSYSYG